MPLVKPPLPTLKGVTDKVIDPPRIRAMMTGIGQTQQRSELTGARRAECVRDCMPPGVASKSSGFPPRDDTGGVYASCTRPSLDAALDMKKRP